MKGVMIFLVLTLVVILAEAQQYGPISGRGNTGTTGGLHFGGCKVTRLPHRLGVIINSGNTGTTGSITNEPFECRCTCGTTQGEVASYKLMQYYKD